MDSTIKIKNRTLGKKAKGKTGTDVKLRGKVRGCDEALDKYKRMGTWNIYR
jgi:hypothetical protein